MLFDSDLSMLPSLGRDVKIRDVFEVEDRLFAQTVLALDNHSPKDLAQGLSPNVSEEGEKISRGNQGGWSLTAIFLRSRDLKDR